MAHHFPRRELQQLQAAKSSFTKGGVLIVDNYDSFTYNICNELGRLGFDSRVVRNDAVTIKEIEALEPDRIILGPGPGNPHDPETIGITPEVIRYAENTRTALLGICLGHQALAAYYGGKVVPAPFPVHGKTSALEVMSFPGGRRQPHRSLFQGKYDFERMSPEKVMRYHSLQVDPCGLPTKELVITSVTRDKYKVIMSLQHRDLPLYGVQFHPESFATENGQRILLNFMNAHLGAFFQSKGNEKTYSFAPQKEKPKLPFGLVQRLAVAEQKPFEMREFPCDLPPEQVYTFLHEASPNMFCFESLPHDGSQHEKHSYFGIDPMFVLSASNKELFLDGERQQTDGASPFDILEETTSILQRDAKGDVPDGQHFSGGLAGFLSYEATQYLEPEQFRGRTRPDERTFSYGYFDDGLVYNPATKKYSYFTRGRDRMDYFRQILEKRVLMVQPPVISNASDMVSRDVFEDRVRRIQKKEIRTGNAFQVVLSREKTYSITGSMAPLYQRMRELCPSAHMHAIKMGEYESMGALPEIAMQVIDGNITSLPLAGTVARTGHEPTDTERFKKLRQDPKEVAEHSMLVDLARNDVTRVAELGSVTVPEELLMHRKDAGAVMHIASEIRGKLQKDIPPIRALLTTAPMGTASGAPKISAMQIIDQCEHFPRGLYASCIGYIDVRGNLKATLGLRSLMRHRHELKIQAGAGIVMDSDPAAEYEETENKMQVPLRTIEPFLIP